MLRIAFIILLAFCGGAAAQDLYGAPPPPNATFVRIIDAGWDGEVIKLAGVEVSVVPASASDYTMLTAGSVDLAGQQALLEPQKYYSLVLQSNGQTFLMVDQVRPNKAKASIEFFNLTDVPNVDLAVASGSPVIFDDLAAGASATRDVNPLVVAFALVLPEGIKATSAEVALERGSVYSVIASGTAAAIQLTVVKNAVASN